MIEIQPKELKALDESVRQELCNIFDRDPHKLTDRPGRTRGHNIDPAMQILRPIVDDLLGVDNWQLDGAIFFETVTGYRVHADTEKFGPHRVWQTIVFPLRQELTEQAQPEKNRLIIFDQAWKKDAAFFLKGSPDAPQEYNGVIKDYKDVINLREGYIDPYVEELCPHLTRENFEGLTVDKTFTWTPGIPITFPRNRLHASSAFHRFGITKKLGLSFFLAPNQSKRNTGSLSV